MHLHRRPLYSRLRLRRLILLFKVLFFKFKLSRHKSRTVKIRRCSFLINVIRMVRMCHISIKILFRAEIHCHDHLICLPCPTGTKPHLQGGDTGDAVFHRLHIGKLTTFDVVAYAVLKGPYKNVSDHMWNVLFFLSALATVCCCPSIVPNLAISSSVRFPCMII